MKNQAEIQMSTNQFILDKTSAKKYNVFYILPTPL